MKIELRNVIKQFEFPGGYQEQKIEALGDINLTIESGSTISFSGPSGSGKSTLLSIIGGAAAVGGGEVLFDGAPRTAQELRSIRARIGYSFQETPFIEELSVIENLVLPGLFARRKSTATGAMEFLERFGLDDRFDCFPSSLSGGERRRLSIARSLLFEPRLIVLDEPTSDLDPDWAGRVIDIAFEAAGKAGATMVIASHDPGVCSRAATTFALKGGKLVDP